VFCRPSTASVDLTVLLHTLRTSDNGMKHTYFAFPAEAATHLPTPNGLLSTLRQSDMDFEHFKRLLKTFLFVSVSVSVLVP